MANNVTYWHDLRFMRATLMIVDGTKKKKKGDTLEERNPTWCVGCVQSRRTTRAACGAAYGAWLPIVRGAAYLTDFTVDRSFRENGRIYPRLSSSRGPCAQGVLERFVVDNCRLVTRSPALGNQFEESINAFATTLLKEKGLKLGDAIFLDLLRLVGQRKFIYFFCSVESNLNLTYIKMLKQFLQRNNTLIRKIYLY